MVVTFSRVTVMFPLVDVTRMEVSVVEDTVVVFTVTRISVTETFMASSGRGTTWSVAVEGDLLVGLMGVAGLVVKFSEPGDEDVE